MKIYLDDDEVLAMAARDGVAEQLREALRMSGAMTMIAIAPRAYFAFTERGDSGAGCIEAERPSEWPQLLARLVAMGPSPSAFEQGRKAADFF